MKHFRWTSSRVAQASSADLDSRDGALRGSHIFTLAVKSRPWMLGLLPHGEKCRQAMRGRPGISWERCRLAKNLISLKMSPSSALRAPSPPGGEVVGACDRLLRQVAKVIVKTTVGRKLDDPSSSQDVGMPSGRGPRMATYRGLRPIGPRIAGPGKQSQPLAAKRRTDPKQHQ